MFKFFSRLALVVAVGFMLLMAVGAVVRKKWGKDVDKLSVSTELSLGNGMKDRINFEAKRDQLGVWEIQTDKAEALSFAFGYIHALDREFQTELLRRAATGRLTSVFGESVLSMDRLLRPLVYPAKDEWKSLQKNDPELMRAAEFYVAGRKEYLKNSGLPIPLEYRFFALTREDAATWEPWELFAIARLNAWQFSNDHRGELVRFQLNTLFDSKLAAILSPQEPGNSAALYDQVLAKDFVKGKNLIGAVNGEKLRRLMDSSVPESIYAMNASGKKGKSRASKESGADQSRVAIERSNNFLQNADAGASHLQADAKNFIDNFSGGSANNSDNSATSDSSLVEHGGASNAWLIQDPRVGRPLTLCNDPHLEFSFPSALYPIKYSLKIDAQTSIRATGFSFPGLPFVALGQLEKLSSSEARPWIRSFGITIANYADSQDLVRLSKNTLAQAQVVEEEFEIFDPLTAKKSIKKIPYQWTRYGPRVDQHIEWPLDVTAPPLALDWIGYKNLRSPLGFFLRQNLFSGNSIRDDLERYWDFPNVNLLYIESNPEGKQRAAHMVTGEIFTDQSVSERGLRRDFSTETQARRRIYSDLKSRPYFEVFPSNQETFFLVSANQRVWTGDFGLRSGFEWTQSHRADSIIKNFNKLISNPESSQTHFYSKGIHHFVITARSRINVDRLCGAGQAEFFQPCMNLLAGLDSWNGDADAKDWRPSVAFLWRNLFREKIFFADKKTPTRKEQKFFEKWNVSNSAERAVSALISQKKVERRFEDLTGQKIDQLLTDSFSEALDLLISREGSIVENWSWGRLHAIRWRHPFSKLPQPMGQALVDSMLGPPPAVSGSEESSGTTVSGWSREDPTRMPAVRGAVLRFCSEIDSSGQSTMRWANVTGTSGNPFSEWSRKFSDETWFKNRLLPARD